MECQLWGDDLDYVKRFEFDPFEVEPGGDGKGKGVLVVDSTSEEVVDRSGRSKKRKCASNEKAIVALKNHSEAERRRRERINRHLATLQGLLPSNEKMDKATLLAEVINQVRYLQENAKQVSRGLIMPMDADELIVEPLFTGSQNGLMTVNVKASLCCDFRADLFSDLKQAIEALKVKTHRSEISTLGERVKILFIFSSRNEPNIFDNVEAHRILINAVLQALNSVLYKPPPLPEYSMGSTLSQKRFRTFENKSPCSVVFNKRFKYCSSSSFG